jgi:hypothetical protein
MERIRRGTVQNVSTLVLELRNFVRDTPTLDRAEILNRLDKIGLPSRDGEALERETTTVLDTPIRRLSQAAVATIPGGRALEELRVSLQSQRAEINRLRGLLGLLPLPE